MPSYKDLDVNVPSGKRTIERLLLLRQKLRNEIPRKDLDDNLLLATWNIREFDSPAYGKRLPEAMHYIAEIIAAFDLVAVQEVRDDLSALQDLLHLLGPNWDYLFTDLTEGDPGNKERVAFVFDKRKVKPAGLVGELVFPPIPRKVTDADGHKITVYEPVLQAARTPFLVGFTSGWADFVITSVHIVYGDNKANEPQRVKEIDSIASLLKQKSLKQYEWSRNFILLGDFNIFSENDDTFKALTDHGFEVPPELMNMPSNANRTMDYDQIAFHDRRNKFQTTGRAGVFDYYDTVFTLDDEAAFIPDMGEAYNTTSEGKPRQDKTLYYKTYWRTYQMSDHLPKWVEMKVDFSDAFLAKMLE